MSDDPTPDRLDAILDGRASAETDAEREMLRIAASLRDASAPAPADLHDRVRAMAPAASAPGRPRRRLTATARRRLLIAAPSLAALAVVVVVGALRQDSRPAADAGARSESSLTTPTASAERDATGTRAPSPARSVTPSAGSAPIAVTVVASPAQAANRAAEIRSIIAAAGGTVIAETAQPTLVIAASVPAAGAGAALARLARLSDTSKDAAVPGPAVPSGTGAVRIDITVLQSPVP